MKRLFAPVLVLLLALYGCQIQPETIETTTEPIIAETIAPTEPPGIYEAGSKLERETGGAVHVYVPEQANNTGILLMGTDLVLISGTDSSTLTKFSGENLYISTAAQIGCRILPTDPALQVSENGITYYDHLLNVLIYLDTELNEIKRIPLPETLCGTPALTADQQKLFYCTTNSLRCIDLESGLDRLLKEMHCNARTMIALHSGDTVISCSATDTDGTSQQLYISATDGQLLEQTQDTTTVFTRNDLYFATHQDGSYQELLTGDAEQGPTLLSLETQIDGLFPLLETGGIVLYSETTGAGRLDHYNLRTGKCTSSLSLSGLDPCGQFTADENGIIWFLAYGSDYGQNVLCRWDPNKTPPVAQAVRLSARFTSEDPDEAGLAACRATADALSAKYGVQILIWTDATLFQPWDYTLIPEYQVPVIAQQLETLDEILALYPENFLRKAAETTSCGQIQICLVRDILGNGSADGTLREAVGLQYWDNNGNACLSLSSGKGLLAQDACHELFHIIESRVMTLCKAYDDWNKLNPKGFRYDYDYIANLTREDRHWIDGANRAFIDTYSMSYPREDRARIMEYAMMSGNEACFESDTMQKKLRQLCIGIREAFDLKKSPEVFLWEQYLKEPLN